MYYTDQKYILWHQHKKLQNVYYLQAVWFEVLTVVSMKIQVFWIAVTCYLKNNFNNTFPNIKWKHASTYEINKIIESLKLKNSCGYNEIPTKILKLSTPCILSPWTFICNNSLSTGVFPERLKYAQVRPLYKKGR